ncbi:SOS response-associated peptidase [Halobacillus litoralis]|uniref:SOS response-associated peptidase n=1 Tax=Halobacillus litoralis TaxID=45668 RepID=UPI001CD2CEB2|nr:SOS response-associated peptidase [Halobacillus litoralis]MCA0971931.1 SOS response-associated peptidase [Halobacillus litoralis]
MCGRFTLTVDDHEIRKEFGIETISEDIEPRFNVAPGQKVWTIIQNGAEKRAGQMDWGLIPSWAKDPKIGYKMINARSETAHEKPSFKRLMAQRRCLILADSFYEWKKTDEGKQPMRISLANRNVFAFAGLWDHWKTEEEDRFTCTILTRESNEFMNDIHHRMPVILPRDKQNQWIEPVKWSGEQAHQFVEQLTIEDFDAYPVSSYVNSAKNTGAACIEPLA